MEPAVWDATEPSIVAFSEPSAVADAAESIVASTSPLAGSIVASMAVRDGPGGIAASIFDDDGPGSMVASTSPSFVNEVAVGEVPTTFCGTVAVPADDFPATRGFAAGPDDADAREDTEPLAAAELPAVTEAVAEEGLASDPTDFAFAVANFLTATRGGSSSLTTNRNGR